MQLIYNCTFNLFYFNLDLPLAIATLPTSLSITVDYTPGNADIETKVTLHPKSEAANVVTSDKAFTCTLPKEAENNARLLSETISCQVDNTQTPNPIKTGNYTVTITAADTAHTFSTEAATGAYYRVDAGEATIAQDAVKSQEIDLEDETKKTFAVKFAAKVDPIPRIYGQHYPEVEIPCTLDQTGTTATCSPTEDHLKEGDNKILMRTGCVKTGTDTAIVVKFEGASSMITLGKVLLIALASFLL